MEEIKRIFERYSELDIRKETSSYPSLINFSSKFYKDVAEIYDAITRMKNIQRNPDGFAFNDAAILGLLVRIWKILKEVITYYEKSNVDVVSLLDRQIIESAVMATYLLASDESVIEDYRKCSYKDRLRILRDARSGSGFFQTRSGKRLLASVEFKMKREGFTEASFEVQKRNNWRVQGKSFRDIFKVVMRDDMYHYLYGIPSESVHGSWNDSMDFNLLERDDGGFGPNPFPQAADIRYVSPAIMICNDPFELWLDRIEARNEGITKMFKWISSVNRHLFIAFDNLYPMEEGEMRS